MKRQCVRCGVHLDEPKALRCNKCRERVDEELNGEVSRPFEYYFRFNLKRMKNDYNTMQNVLKKYREER